MYIDEMLEFEIIKTSDKSLRKRVADFLDENGLGIDDDIRQFVIARSGKEIVACAGLASNTLKCIAVAPEFRGASLCVKLVNETESVANQQGEHHLFLLTSPDNVKSFLGCGFYPIVSIENKAVLMENTPVGIHRHCKALRAEGLVTGSKIGGIVMNANPFTLGHQFLIERASSECDWLHIFVVEEDLSQFSFDERIAMVRDGVSRFPNVTVHPGSEYIISRGTFPGYFLKEKKVINDVYTGIDLLIFRKYIAPALDITHRFVGTEPYCKTTAIYNCAMHHWLEDASLLSSKVIRVHEIERITDNNRTPISASSVRNLLKVHDLQAVKKLVPATTIPYLHNQLSKYDYPYQSRLLTG